MRISFAESLSDAPWELWHAPNGAPEPLGDATPVGMIGVRTRGGKWVVRFLLPKLDEHNATYTADFCKGVRRLPELMAAESGRPKSRPIEQQ